MGRQHFHRLDSRDAGGGELLLLAVGQPASCGLVDRLAHLLTLQVGQLIVFDQGKDVAGPQEAGIKAHALYPDAVLVLLQGRIVGHPDRRKNETILLGDVAADLVDAAFEAVFADQNHVDEVRCHFEVDFVRIDGIADPGRFRRGREGGVRLDSCFVLLLFPEDEGEPCKACGRDNEGKEWQARKYSEDSKNTGHDQQRCRIAGKLLAEGKVDGAFFTSLGEEKCGSDRHDHGRDLGDQTVTDSEDRVVVQGVDEAELVRHNPEADARQQVQDGDHQARDGIALDKLRGAVERAEEGGFFLFALAADLGFFMADRADGQIRVDRQLLAGHGVKGEARADFRHAPGAFRDHHEIHNHDDAEYNEADEQVSAHDEHGEAFDHVTRGIGTCVPLPDNQLGRRDVQRQPENECGKQDAGEGREIERLFDKDHGRENQDRKCEGYRQANIDDPGGHRQHHDENDDHQADRQERGRIGEAGSFHFGHRDLSGNKRQDPVIEQIERDLGHVTERKKENDDDGEDLRNEGQRHLLDRREGLQEADGEADDERRRQDRQPHHGSAPDMGAQDLENFAFGHDCFAPQTGIRSSS